MGTGIYSLGGTRIACENANLSGAGGSGLIATNGSSVHAAGANCSGAAANGVQSTRGASVNARGVNARKGASNGTFDFAVIDGGTIVATAGIGGTNITPNTITANGIIFQ